MAGMPETQLIPVRVRVECERTVYVEASTPAEARQRASDVTQWADADPPDHERTETVRVIREQRIELPAPSHEEARS